MNADDAVLAVCRLPVDFYSIGNVSAIDLLGRSGYLDFRTEVGVERLAACLADHPDWVGAWFSWSEDNRSTPAWGIGGVGNDRYQVGYLGAKGAPETRPLEFEGKVRACAEYVYRVLGQLSESDAGSVPAEMQLWRDLRGRESRDIRER